MIDNVFFLQWDLVCDKAWLRATGDSLFMVGVMLGSMIFGGLSDKYGRRPIFFLSLVIQLAGGILVAVAPEFISYVIFRLIVGSTTSGVFLVAYVIGKLNLIINIVWFIIYNLAFCRNRSFWISVFKITRAKRLQINVIIYLFQLWRWSDRKSG